MPSATPREATPQAAATNVQLAIEYMDEQSQQAGLVDYWCCPFPIIGMATGQTVMCNLVMLLYERC